MDLNLRDEGNFYHKLRSVTLPGVVVYYSYDTPVAIKTRGYCIVRENDWSTVTAKHLNYIDGGDKKSRIEGDFFVQIFEHIQPDKKGRYELNTTKLKRMIKRNYGKAKLDEWWNSGDGILQTLERRS